MGSWLQATVPLLHNPPSSLGFLSFHPESIASLAPRFSAKLDIHTLAYDFGIFSMQASHPFPHLPALLDFEIIRVTWFGQQNEAKVMVGHLQV